MATIFCFTSTGNSLYAAKVIADKLNGKVISMSKSVESCEDDIIGFVFPTYFWGLPVIVEQFISNLIIKNNNAYIFSITTYGGTVKGVLGAVDQLLKKKGLSLTYGNKLKSVENYIPGYKVNNTEELHKQVDDYLETIIREIREKKANKVEKYTLVNKFIYSLFPAKKKDCDKNFNVSENCNQCGICQNICPVDNIKLADVKIDFLHTCEHCLACIHACPQKAIQWKKSTIDKERYRNPYISLKELSEFNSLN